MFKVSVHWWLIWNIWYFVTYFIVSHPTMFNSSAAAIMEKKFLQTLSCTKRFINTSNALIAVKLLIKQLYSRYVKYSVCNHNQNHKQQVLSETFKTLDGVLITNWFGITRLLCKFQGVYFNLHSMSLEKVRLISKFTTVSYYRGCGTVGKSVCFASRRLGVRTLAATDLIQ